MEAPAKIGEVLKSRPPNTAKLSSVSICQVCGKRPATSLADNLCPICHRASKFAQLPPEQQKNEILSVVPERFLRAKMADLTESLRKVFNQEIDTGVMLWGAPGIGKTYAMAALAKNYIKEGFLVRRTNYELLCLQIRDTFNKNAQKTEWQVIEPLLNCDKLFIEDVGTSKSIESKESDFSLRTLLVLLDMRLEHCRPTFVTTNKSVENLAKSFDGRVGDRLRMFKIFQMKGQSKR